MKKRILITSALPYVNNVPHLGNLICVISADAFTKFLRLKKENVISVCGTDEHGTTTETKAIEEKITPKQVCDKYFKIHKRIYEWFGCDFTCFGRTSSKATHEITKDIFKKLYKNGYIKEKELEQFYCKKCDRWLADRFIEGTCPHCGYEHARGDQCENCGKLLEATELKNAKCKICDKKPEIKKSKHLFIDLPKLTPKLKKWIQKAQNNWAENAKTMTNAWLKEGLKERCITRNLKWGVKVPLKGYEDKVFYSWFDAPIGYISITKDCRKDWAKWWKNPKETTLVQFMGKDNVPFHTIMFPAFLIGTKEKYTLLSHMSSNEYLNYEAGQFSKSRSIGVFGDDAINTGIPGDVWRYYLIVNRPEKMDSEFSWKDFQAKLNNELVANLGNLVNRTLTFINRFYDSKVPKGTLKTDDKAFLKKIVKKEEQIEKLIEKIEIKAALKEIMDISHSGNQYFQKKEPWKTKNTACMFVLANLIKDLSILIQPFLPATAENITKQLNIKQNAWDDLGKLSVKPDHKIKKARILFKKIEDREIEKFKQKYGGKKKTETKTEIFPLNLKIAKVTKAENHLDADKLMILKIDLGAEQRQLVAGLKDYYSNEELEGKNIVVVTNLKYATLRGVESQGMLLAAEKNNKVKLLEAPNSSPGDIVYIENHENSKKEITIEEFAKIKMTTKNKKIIYKGKPLKTDSEEIKVDIEDGAEIK